MPTISTVDECYKWVSVCVCVCAAGGWVVLIPCKNFENAHESITTNSLRALVLYPVCGAARSFVRANRDVARLLLGGKATRPADSVVPEFPTLDRTFWYSKFGFRERIKNEMFTNSVGRSAEPRTLCKRKRGSLTRLPSVIALTNSAPCSSLLDRRRVFVRAAQTIVY